MGIDVHGSDLQRRGDGQIEGQSALEGGDPVLAVYHKLGRNDAADCPDQRSMAVPGVCLTAISTVGTNTKTTFTNVSNSIGSSGGGS